jgi:phage repressor protein C with HTH and peptisase S24 domain
MSEQTFADRLRLVQGRDSVNAMASKCGIPYTTLRQYFGGTEPSATNVAKIAQACGVDLTWLITGNGEMRPESLGFHEDQARYRVDDVGLSGLVVVRRLDGYVLTEQEYLAEMLAFPASLLVRIGLSATTARLLVVRGDSMAPTLQHGDLVLLDTSVESVKESGIFAVSVDDRVFVKRIQPRYDGSLQVVSDNPIYPPEKISATDAAAFKIVGQVRWFGRSI